MASESQVMGTMRGGWIGSIAASGIYDLTRKYFLFGRDRLVRQLGASRRSALSKSAAALRAIIRIAGAMPG
jgi:hypothetical protein